MDIRVIYEFLALSDNLNYSQTAKLLYISQSQLSKHIKIMEGELGVRLFTRDTHGVSLTPAGALLSDKFRRVLSDYEDAVALASHLQNEQTSSIQIAHLSATSGSFLPQACFNFRETRKNTRITFRALEVDDVVSAVRRGEVDLGVSVLADGIAPEGIVYQTLSIDGYGILVDKKNKLARKDFIVAKDLAGATILVPNPDLMPQTSHAVQRFLKRTCPEVAIRKDMNDISSIVPILMEPGGLVCTVGHVADLFEPESCFIPFADSGCRKPLYAVMWRSDRETPDLLELVNHIAQSYEKLKCPAQ